MSRFRIVEKPAASPYACLINHTAKEKWYIDLGLSLEYEGAAYLGEQAVAEIARVAHFVPREYHQSVVLENERLKNELTDALAQLDQFRSLAPGLRKLCSILDKRERAAEQVRSGGTSAPSGHGTQPEELGGQREGSSSEDSNGPDQQIAVEGLDFVLGRDSEY